MSDDFAVLAKFVAIMKVAEVAAELYDRAEHPGKYGDNGTMQALAEWFPQLRDALVQAEMLK